MREEYIFFVGDYDSIKLNVDTRTIVVRQCDLFESHTKEYSPVESFKFLKALKKRLLEKIESCEKKLEEIARADLLVSGFPVVVKLLASGKYKIEGKIFCNKKNIGEIKKFIEIIKKTGN